MTAPPPSAAPVHVDGLAQVSLSVRDLEAAVTFYRDVLGLGHLFSVDRMAFLDLGGTRLYLQAVDADAWRAGSILYLLVADATAAQEALAARGVEVLAPPQRVHTDETTGLEEWIGFVRDPDGNILGLLARVPAELGR